MKASQIEVGGRYLAKVSGRVVPVVVKSIIRNHRDQLRYNVENTVTGRSLVFMSAQKFRGIVARTSVPEGEKTSVKAPKSEPQNISNEILMLDRIEKRLKHFEDHRDEFHAAGRADYWHSRVTLLSNAKRHYEQRITALLHEMSPPREDAMTMLPGGYIVANNFTVGELVRVSTDPTPYRVLAVGFQLLALATRGVVSFWECSRDTPPEPSSNVEKIVVECGGSLAELQNRLNKTRRVLQFLYNYLKEQPNKNDRTLKALIEEARSVLGGV